jgi:hypothetical protein
MTSQPRTTSRFETASFEFSSALFERVLDGLSPAPSEQVISCRNVPDQTAHDLNRRILAELAMPSEPLYGEMLCLAMAVHMLRQYGRTRVHALRFKGRLSPIQAGRVLDYMHANLDRRLSISALAHEAGLSDVRTSREPSTQRSRSRRTVSCFAGDSSVQRDWLRRKATLWLRQQWQPASAIRPISRTLCAGTSEKPQLSC